jgi:hypothetical protein
MIARALFVWLFFSLILLSLGLYSQGELFELSHCALALGLSLPVAVAVVRGGLGDAETGRLQYPSLTLMVVSAWILTVGPSLVVESEASRYLYHYSDAALTLGRVFFFAWCLLFVVASGKPRLQEIRTRPSMADFIALVTVTLVIAAFLVRSGIFSFYQAGRDRTAPVAGTTESVATVLGAPLFMLLPSLLFLLLMRMQARASRTLIVLLGFLGSWTLLFLLGSRTSVAVAVACCLLFCRGLGLRLRANVIVGLGVALPAALMLILVYRTALGVTHVGVNTVSQYLSIASEATVALNEENAQSNAIEMVSNNARVRMWYGQQFCVLIDQWLDEGAALRGTIFSGVISSLPTLLVSDKNALADELNFEVALFQSQRFPEIDLAPTPWMQWLYELGILGIVVGPLLYAWLARVIQSRLSKTRSLYETLFWLQLFVSMLPAEHTTDSLVLHARGILVHVLLIGGLSRGLTWLSTLGRRDGRGSQGAMT